MFSVTNITSALCFGENGSVVVNGAGGSGGYVFSWQSLQEGISSWLGSGGVISLPAGRYSFSAMDLNNCSGTNGDSTNFVVNITQPGSHSPSNKILLHITVSY